MYAILKVLHEEFYQIKLDQNSNTITYPQTLKEPLLSKISIISELIGGEIQQKITCSACPSAQILINSFFHLSLPIPKSASIALKVYFVYRDSTKSPKEVMVYVSPNALTVKLVEVVCKNMRIHPQNSELVMIKDHKIIEYNTSELTCHQLTGYEGVPFIYEIERFNEKYLYKFELYLKHDNDAKFDKELSFRRIFYLNLNVTLQEIHVEIYKLMRNYLKVYNENIQKDNPYVSLMNLKIDKPNSYDFDEEYVKFLQFEHHKNGLPYRLFYHAAAGMGIFKTPLEYSETMKLYEIFDNSKQTIQIEVLFNKWLKIDFIRFNQSEIFGRTLEQEDLQKYTLYDCFDLFQNQRLKFEEEQWSCNDCKTLEGIKTTEIKKAPKILIIHLDRFKLKQDYGTKPVDVYGLTTKRGNLIDFPIDNLDIKKYLAGNNKNLYNKCEYELFAVCNHYGNNIENGHYAAFIKNNPRESWYNINDDVIIQKSPEKLVTSAAYILFYKRKDQIMNSILNETTKCKACRYVTDVIQENLTEPYWKGTCKLVPCKKITYISYCVYCNKELKSLKKSDYYAGELIKCDDVFQCNREFQLIKCPFQHLNVFYYHNKYQMGVEVSCKTCEIIFQQVTCPHCHLSNYWMAEHEKDVYHQGIETTLSNCQKEFQHVNCPYCGYGEFFKDCKYEWGTNHECIKCHAKYVQLNCLKCLDSILSSNLHFQISNKIDCPNAKCRIKFDIVKCPHCSQLNKYEITSNSNQQNLLEVKECKSCLLEYCVIKCPTCLTLQYIEIQSEKEIYECPQLLCPRKFEIIHCPKCDKLGQYDINSLKLTNYIHECPNSECKIKFELINCLKCKYSNKYEIIKSSSLDDILEDKTCKSCSSESCYILCGRCVVSYQIDIKKGEQIHKCPKCKIFGISTFLCEKCQQITTCDEKINPKCSICTLPENMVELKECCVCLNDRVSHVLIPCGHACTCGNCYQKMNNKCPICKGRFEKAVKFYIS